MGFAALTHPTNGRQRWTARLEVSELIEPTGQGLERYRPQLRYLLLEERAFGDPVLAPLQSRVAGLFRLEQARTADEVQALLQGLQGWFRGESRAAIERAFLTWFKRVLLPARWPGVELPEALTLQEMTTVLTERVKEWTEQWKQAGLEQGRQEGREEGRQEGLEQGTRQGEVMLLRRQLVHRFGPLPGWVEAKIEGADTAVLEGWAKRILEAQELEAVFRD